MEGLSSLEVHVMQVSGGMQYFLVSRLHLCQAVLQVCIQFMFLRCLLCNQSQVLLLLLIRSEYCSL